MLTTGSYLYGVIAHSLTGSATTQGNFKVADLGVLMAQPGENGLMLYPNPVAAGTQTLLIRNSNFPATSVVLFDALGRTVSEQHFAPGAANEVAIGSLKPGFYLCSVRGNGKESKASFVIR